MQSLPTERDPSKQIGSNACRIERATVILIQWHCLEKELREKRKQGRREREEDKQNRGVYSSPRSLNNSAVLLQQNKKRINRFTIITYRKRQEQHEQSQYTNQKRQSETEEFPSKKPTSAIESKPEQSHSTKTRKDRKSVV